MFSSCPNAVSSNEVWPTSKCAVGTLDHWPNIIPTLHQGSQSKNNKSGRFLKVLSLYLPISMSIGERREREREREKEWGEGERERERRRRVSTDCIPLCSTLALQHCNICRNVNVHHHRDNIATLNDTEIRWREDRWGEKCCCENSLPWGMQCTELLLTILLILHISPYLIPHIAHISDFLNYQSKVNFCCSMG